MRCHYNMVNFLQIPHNRHPISRPWGSDMGCSRARYGVSVVNTNSKLCSVWLIRVLYAMSPCIEVHYNGTRLYFSMELVQYNRYVVSTVNTDGCISGKSWLYTHVFQVFSAQAIMTHWRHIIHIASQIWSIIGSGNGWLEMKFSWYFTHEHINLVWNGCPASLLAICSPSAR